MIQRLIFSIIEQKCPETVPSDLAIGGRFSVKISQLWRAAGLGSSAKPLWALLFFGLLACSSLKHGETHGGEPAHARQAPSIIDDPFRFESWAAETRSPRVVNTEKSLELLQNLCGRPDAALIEVANRLAKDERFGSRPDDLDRLAFALRASGAPYVWPRAWSLTIPGAEANPEVLVPRFEHWLGSFSDGGQRRCGISRDTGRNGTRYAAVVSDVFADLVKPLPIRVRTGQWLDLEVHLLGDASDAKVILEGPRNEPGVVPSTINQSEVRSRFPMSGPGSWLIQVLATTDTGPRPVVEAEVFVDEKPPEQLELRPAPGESARGQGEDSAQDLYLMLNAARVSEGRKALSRDQRLDRLAREHATAMLAAGHIGHDVGDGSPKSRLENAGVFAALAGENVAHAADVLRAHRALWTSPSHRSNILHRGFRNVGLGVVRGPDDTVWACELFAALD